MSTTLLDGGTTTTAGGSTQTFDRTNTTVTSGSEYADVSETDFFARQKVIITTRMPSLQLDGSWSKQKTKVQFVAPITLANGTIAYNIARVEIEAHPESSAANLAELREFAAQMAVGTQFDYAYIAGTLPD
jgi:hypothetical protein